MGFPEVEFNASHPFLFFIEDEVTGTVIFEGKFVYPKITTANLDVAQTEPPPKFNVDVKMTNDDLDRFVNTPRQPPFPEKVTAETVTEKVHKGNLDGTPWELSKSP